MEVRKGYKQTEVGVIPEDWEVLPVSSFGETKRGAGSLAIKYKSSGGIRLIRINDFFQDNPVFVEPTDDIMRFRIHEQDLLFAGTGASAGASFLPKKEWIGLPHSYNAPRIRVFEKNSKKYLLFSLKSDYVRKQQRAWFVGNAQPFLDTKAISSFSIATPPTLAEQEAIAEALSDADALIESLETLLAKKRQVKQGAMSELLSGKRRLSGFEKKKGYKNTEIGTIPEDWEVVLMGSLGAFTKGMGIKKDEALSGEIPCVRYGEIYTHHNDVVREFNSWISPEVAKTSKRLKKGDLLFAGSGETKEEIGKCVAFTWDVEAYAGGDIVILTPKTGATEFFGYLFNAPVIVKQKASKGQGDAVVHISSSTLSTIRVPFPILPEQTAIAEILSDMDAEIRAVEEKLSKARGVKAGMMSELLTGRVRLA